MGWCHSFVLRTATTITTRGTSTMMATSTTTSKTTKSGSVRISIPKELLGPGYTPIVSVKSSKNTKTESRTERKTHHRLYQNIEGKRPLPKVIPNEIPVRIQRPFSMDIQEIFTFRNLCLAYHKARLGKRHKKDVILFEDDDVSSLVNLRDEILSVKYRIDIYQYFRIYEPKERKINSIQGQNRPALSGGQLSLSTS